MIHRIVLDIELGDAQLSSQLIAPDKWSEPGMKSSAGWTFDRQQFVVPPEILGPRCDLIGRHPNRTVVVDWFERPETAIADVRGNRRKRRLTEMTLQTD